MPVLGAPRVYLAGPDVFFSTALQQAAKGAVEGLAGRVLHVLVGYRDHPGVLEALAYVATAAAIFGLSRLAQRDSSPPAAIPQS